MLGTLFFWRVEGWSVLDAFYFCVLTFATVGAENMAPASLVGKVFATLIALAGVGIMLGLFYVVVESATNDRGNGDTAGWRAPYAFPEALEDSWRSKLTPFLHVPFDKYSLSVLRNCVSDRHRPPIGRIRRDVTMKFVDGEAKYEAMMTLIRKIADEADCPPIHLDMLAWNRTHT